MKQFVVFSIVFLWIFIFLSANVNAQGGMGVNQSGSAADPSAIFDASSTTKGQLMPRMTTMERNAISSPATGLLIFNIDCGNINYYFNGAWYPLNNGVNGLPGAAGTITGSATVCQGQSNVSYSVPAISAATNYTWTYSGTGATISGTTNSITINFSGAATSGNLTVSGSNACGNGIISTSYPVTVNAIPAAPTANTHIPDQTLITWNWNTVSTATGYKWETTNSYSSAIDNGTSTSYTQTGLTCGTAYTLYVWVYNGCGNSTPVVLTQSTAACIQCNQVWASANLNAGTQISQATAQTSNQKWCFNNVTANCDTYGGLYQWSNVMLGAASVNCDPCGPTTGHGGVQGMCPSGYHIPSDLEWSRYEFCVESTVAPIGSASLADFQGAGWRGSIGSKIRATPPAWDGTNASGFTALHGGFSNNGSSGDTSGAYFWTATQSSSTTSWFHYTVTGNSQTLRIEDVKTYGYSVRCLQD